MKKTLRLIFAALFIACSAFAAGNLLIPVRVFPDRTPPKVLRITILPEDRAEIVEVLWETARANQQLAKRWDNLGDPTKAEHFAGVADGLQIAANQVASYLPTQP